MKELYKKLYLEDDLEGFGASKLTSGFYTHIPIFMIDFIYNFFHYIYQIFII